MELPSAECARCKSKRGTHSTGVLLSVAFSQAFGMAAHGGYLCDECFEIFKVAKRTYEAGDSHGHRWMYKAVCVGLLFAGLSGPGVRALSWMGLVMGGLYLLDFAYDWWHGERPR